jgi:cadmium resistance protein CadD (predicted permease)
MIGFAVALVLPTEPIGFLGLLPVLLGVWKLLDLFFPNPDEDEATVVSRFSGTKNILKVSLVTVMNGGDNIGTYTPLFAQAKGSQIAVYVVVYYILLGIWCLVAFLVMKQKYILKVVQRYAEVAIPFLYMGLGIYITVNSECFPWSIEHIDDSTSTRPGEVVMAVATTSFLLTCLGAMLWPKLRSKATEVAPNADAADEQNAEGHIELAVVASHKSD